MSGYVSEGGAGGRYLHYCETGPLEADLGHAHGRGEAVKAPDAFSAAS